MEFKGSKSPWHIGSHPFEYRNRHTIRSDDNTVIAHVSQPSDNEQSARADADVRLISAAPELLQVLQLIVSYHDDGNRSLHREDLEMARKAISKALGQQ
ncbi:hypothetical protein QDQ39_07635 [Providencia rettgeri]|uniref:hypothetical protein n=1 Tax=Providencia rettgeri TaxID=587 RepID=UPI002446D1A5|nr:hypothetical protein [Providencia rettgeri]MDH2395676.1 hypothetical protein [Providencia rettgeri]